MTWNTERWSHVVLGGAYIKFELGFCLVLAGVVTITLNLGVAIKSRVP